MVPGFFLFFIFFYFLEFDSTPAEKKRGKTGGGGLGGMGEKKERENMRKSGFFECLFLVVYSHLVANPHRVNQYKHAGF